MKETAEKTAEVYGGTASVEMISESAADLRQRAYQTDRGLYAGAAHPRTRAVSRRFGHASEDFASVAERVPSAFLYLSAGFLDERGDAPRTTPKVRFNEDVCPIGVSCLTHCAIRWLEENR